MNPYQQNNLLFYLDIGNCFFSSVLLLLVNQWVIVCFLLLCCSFSACAENIYVAVVEMVSLFPQVGVKSFVVLQCPQYDAIQSSSAGRSIVWQLFGHRSCCCYLAQQSAMVFYRELRDWFSCCDTVGRVTWRASSLWNFSYQQSPKVLFGWSVGDPA